ncbi:MAG: choice-of-anchor D domain-containing protein, partial [Bryocella sp.]
MLALATSSGFAPTLVSLTGTGAAILAANNGTLDVGDSYAGEPIQIVLPVTQSLPSLSANVSSPFAVAIVANSGTPPGILPPTAFAASATAPCSGCYLVVEFLSQSVGSANGTLTLSTVSNGSPYVTALTVNALAVSGLVLSPSQQTFGEVPVQSVSAAQIFSLANLVAPISGTTIQRVSVSGEFQVVPNLTGGASCSGTVNPTDACYLEVAFSPVTVGPHVGTLIVTTDQGTVTSALIGYATSNPGVSFSPSSLIYRAVPDVSSGTQTVTVTNTGSALLTIGAPSSSSASFMTTSTCAMVAPGATCLITVDFTPGPAPVTATLTLPITASLNGQTIDLTTSLALSGTYTAQEQGFEILPSVVNLGAVAPGLVGLTREFTLHNLTAQQFTVKLQMPRDFPLADPNACSTVAPESSCQFSVSFLPAVAGPRTGTVFARGASTSGATAQGLMYLLSYGVGAASLTLTGFGIPNAPLTFAQLQSGQTATTTLMLTNNGSTAATVRRVSSNPPFLTSTTCGATLSQGASCGITVTYSPIDEVTAQDSLLPRNDSGVLTIESDAIDSPRSVLIVGSVAPIASSSPSSGASLATYTLSEGALTFANTETGSPSQAQTVTVQNTGTDVLHFSSILA